MELIPCNEKNHLIVKDFVIRVVSPYYGVNVKSKETKANTFITII